MTRIRSLDALGDWTFGKGKNNYVTQLKAVSQNLKTRLKSFLGDCFFALNEGVDWFNLLGTNQEAEIKLAIATTILNTENVIELKEISYTVDGNRKLTITYSVDTTFGELQNQSITTEI